MLALEVNSAAADAVGHITEFGVASGLNPGSFPRGIAPGPDGNLWFADTGTASAIGRISPFNGHIDEFSADRAKLRPGRFDARQPGFGQTGSGAYIWLASASASSRSHVCRAAGG